MNVLASNDGMAFNHTVIQSFPVAVLVLVVSTSHHQLPVFFITCILQKQLGHYGSVVRVDFHQGNDCREFDSIVIQLQLFFYQVIKIYIRTYDSCLMLDYVCIINFLFFSSFIIICNSKQKWSFRVIIYELHILILSLSGFYVQNVASSSPEVIADYGDGVTESVRIHSR